MYVYRLWPYRMHSYKATKHLWSYFRILSPYVTGSYCFYSPIQKWVSPSFGLDAPCRHPCWWEIHTEAACSPKFAPLAQDPAAFYTLLYANVYQSQLQPSELFRSSYNSYLVWLLGQITFITKNNCKKGRCGDSSIFCHHHKISLWKHENICIM